MYAVCTWCMPGVHTVRVLGIFHRGRFARRARAVHKFCTGTYPTYIAVLTTNDN